MDDNKKSGIGYKQKLRLLCFSFYNLDYGIGASATFLDQLNNLPQNIVATVIEPKRVDLPSVEIELKNNVERVILPVPLTSLTSFLFPIFALFYSIKNIAKLQPSIIFSMHHPFHSLSVTGHFISKLFHVSHIVDLRDVWRNMGVKGSSLLRWQDFFERLVVRLIKNDLMVFVCSENKLLLESRTNLKFKNSLVLPNCVSDSLIENIKRNSNREKNVINFIFVGRVGSEYGLNKVQPILDILPSFGYTPRLLVVGHNQVGMPSKYCTFVGSLTRKETIQLISESDVGIGPFYPTIAVPRKVVEYLALGKIVIFGKNAISKDIIKTYGEFLIEISETDDLNEVVTNMLKKLDTIKYDSKKMEPLYCTKRMNIIIKRVLGE
ncbi:MAG: hypothetical protein IAX22_07505 [Candidatus Bathyarchaeota archaeon]|nr:hypothetical protein [Candidatus Bathyarchaeota archaeon]